MTTTPDRDLTPFEVTRLDKMRVAFSGMPDGATLVAETRADMLTLPVPPACPAWCTLPVGHTYEGEATDGMTVRFHTWTVDNVVTVDQEERRATDGTLAFGKAFATVDRDDEVTAEGCDYLVAALTEAASLVRQVNR